MSSPPPKGWQQQLNQGLGEGEIFGETKSRYYNMLVSIEKEATKRRIPFTILMMDILGKWMESNNVQEES